MTFFTIPRRFLTATALLMAAVVFDWEYRITGINQDLREFITSGLLGMLNGSLAILAVDTVFGTRPFWQRFGEGVAWILGCLAIFYSIIQRSIDQEILVVSLLIPWNWLVYQFPLYGLAYFWSGTLRTADDNRPARGPWSLRDWIIGSVWLSIALALAKLATNWRFWPISVGDAWVFSSCFTAGNVLLLVLPAMFYVLRTRTSREVLLWAVVHHGITFVVIGRLVLGVNSRGSDWQLYVIWGCILLGTQLGLSTFRAAGLQLIMERERIREPATNAPLSDCRTAAD